MGKTLRKLLIAGAFILVLTGDCSGNKAYASHHGGQTHFESLDLGYKVAPFAMMGAALVTIAYAQYRDKKDQRERENS